ncbi:hypothetical protein ACIBG0_39140 [Nocardia sp. NPDC050630]|uniref:hypothetical protein n=1 Tax=Nocardia sp. NPDC050630 TaxID=3364321 RepID=UPI003795D3BA
MKLPTEPGFYRDVKGDLWLLEADRWTHAARRLNDDSLRPVMGRFTGEMTADQFEHLATGPSVDVLPLERVEAEDVPPQID